MQSSQILSSADCTATNSERLFNVLVGASVLSWGVLSWHRASTVEGLSLVRVCTSALHFAVAFAFLRREALIKNGSLMSLIVSLPSLILCGVAFRLAPVPTDWPPIAQSLFAAGTLLAVWSILTLGRSFSVLPAVRSIVARGPYRWLRHPMYLGELMLVFACVLAQPGWQSIATTLVIVFFVICRIIAEEQTLGSVPDYHLYADEVKWRVIPGLW